MITRQLTIILSILLVGCSYKGVYNVEQLRLIPINKESKNSNVQLQIGSPDLQVTPSGMFKRQMVFDVKYKNTTSDTILIDPSQFKYWAVYSDNYPSTDRKYVLCINPDLSLEKMRKNKANLSSEKNPYSHKDKSTGAIITSALIEGTFNLISGTNQDDENYQSRAEKELEWNKEKKSMMEYLTTNIEFFENEALLKTSLSPNMTVSGKILFPIETKAKRIELILPIGTESTTIRFTQQIDWY